MAKKYFIGTILCFLFLISTALLFGGNPIGIVPQHEPSLITIPRQGEPLLWKGPTIPYWPDRGSMGLLPNRSAKNLLSKAFHKWSDACKSIGFLEKDGIYEDINGSNFRDYVGINDGISPIIFDNDRQILRELGLPKEVLGVSGPEFISVATGYVVEAYSIINTDPWDGDKSDECGELDEKFLEAVLVHEFGHYIGLGHSQVNGDAYFANRSVAGFGVPPENMVETMYPFLTISQSTLKYDDIVTVNWLYSPSTYFNATASFHGTVVQPYSVREAQGVNVIARNVNTNDPLAVYRDAVSQISGVLYHPDIDAPVASPGEFYLPGIPAMVPMRVEIEALGEGEFPVFQKRNPLLVVPEFYNGVDEASSNPPDDPSDAVIVLLPAREEREIQIALNQSIYVTGLSPSSAPSHSDTFITVYGEGFHSESYVLLMHAATLKTVKECPAVFAGSNQIGFTLPYELSVGSYRVYVVNPPGGEGNVSTNYQLLEVTSSPLTITSIVPSQALYNSNDPVQVRGTNFYSQMVVYLSHQQHGYEISLQARVIDPGLLTFVAPAEVVPGQYNLRVVRPPAGAENESSSLSFTILKNDLSIGSLSPSSIYETTNPIVTLIGSGFTNHSFVRITALSNGLIVTATPIIVSPTDLSFHFPMSLMNGEYTVAVIRPPGDSNNISNAIPINVIPLPTTTTTTSTSSTTSTTTSTSSTSTTSTSTTSTSTSSTSSTSTLMPVTTSTLMIPTTTLLWPTTTWPWNTTTSNPYFTTTSLPVTTSLPTTTSTSTTLSTTTTTIFNLQPFGQLETPPSGSTVQDSISVDGWAVDDQGTLKVTLMIDGDSVAVDVTRILRSDIAALFPQFPNSDTAGFHFDFDTNTLPDGFHQITVLFEDRLGSCSLSGSRVVYVLNHP